MRGIRLTGHEVAGLYVAQQALLSPLRHDDPVEWQLRANRAVRRLLGADHSVFSVPADAGPGLVTDDTDSSFPERFLGYCTGVERGEYRFRDPYVENAGRMRRAAGTGAFHETALGSREAVRHSVAYQEIFIPAGLTNLVGFSTPLPVGEATQFFSFQGARAVRRSERGAAVLHLLVPAFEAGVRIQRRLALRRTALASVFDRLGQAAAIHSSGGAALHQTDALASLLAAEPEAHRLREAVGALARRLAARWSRRERTMHPPAPDDARAYVRTRAMEYRLLGSYLDADVAGAECVLVLVERLRPVLPSSAALDARFGLTPREAQVAVLLAEGLTDGAIATRLGLRAPTARRHTERVLRKLGVHSRAAVALTLLGPPAPAPQGGDESP